MLQVSNWIRSVVAIVLLAGFVIALPNVLPDSVRAKIPSWLPSQTVSLGLDLQGGSYLLLEVELDTVTKDKLDSLTGDVRRALRRAHPSIGYVFATVPGDAIAVQVKDPARFEEAHGLIQGLNPAMGTGVFGAGAKAYEFSDNGHGLYTLRMTDDYKKQTQQEIIGQSIEVVRKRIDELGTREPTIEREGDDRIVVQVPGLSDPEHLKKILGKTAKMSFQLVDEAADRSGAAQRGVAPIGDEILPMAKDKNGVRTGPPIVVEKRIVVAGDRLTTAKQDFNQTTGETVVDFAFDSVGAKEFGDITKAYPPQTQRFAIVLDKEIISAPLIQDPILGGSGYITGHFTVESANDLATLLRAGALPAPLKVIAERTVGAELGADSVKAGRYSALAGLVLVALFMIARYGLFGLFADVALTLNVVLLMAALTLFGATLTLPGIAGIVLTMGMAVDANVLIYERIREEQRNGRSMLASIDQGFQRARATIFDANMTHLIASAILFELGSGPVRGFAVTLAIGVLTSFFTATMVTRLIVLMWLNIRRPRRLAI
ncbi:MAG TPA: protein translocase subunit SecD [Rhizomicrobium sp.]|jgi:preprotein translocase subunit SecD|nr:protein translocase subunit SecD [Rhizomicrobium sp.]